ncbi:MAG TPA: hypothetical protein EYN88_03520 [Candidatus Poseidoniales archaeon]|nr:hypothetical protein [Candidatus Poseidoniales archaeon]
MPRRKYGRLRKVVTEPSAENCSRCRSGKFCPIETHPGYNVKPERDWVGPAELEKRRAKKNPGAK